MKNKEFFICTIILFLISSSLLSQNFVNNFVSDVEHRYSIFKITENKSISTFMKYGYNEYPYLKSDSIKKIPIFSIYGNKKYIYQTSKSKDSLLIYMNPQSIVINEVLFINADTLIASAFRQYTGKKEQLVTKGGVLERQLAHFIVNESPDLIFVLCESNYVYFFVKNNMVTCYCGFCGVKKIKKMYLHEFIAECIDNSNIIFLTGITKPSPIVYSK